MNDFPRCVECGRVLSHKDDEEMKLVEQMLKSPEVIYSSRERDRAVRFLWSLLHPASQ